jgi:endonuclease/exonuclease/phosphatase family metal-dependent hydrolase
MQKEIPSLKVMSWNVLASAAVKYHQGGKEESGSQRKKRHSKILKTILKENCDLILLQEVDRDFVSALRKSKKYKVVWKLPRMKLNPNAFGNAVLYNDKLKKQGKAENLIWGKDQTTYDRKNALYVKFRWGDTHVDTASLHLSGRKGKAREKLFNDTLDRLDSKYKIVGGDFNCDMGPMAGCVDVRDLQTRNVSYTTCAFDYDPERRPHEIDKILVSPNFSIKYYKTRKTNCRGRSPYSRSGSDHFPLFVTLSVKAKKSRKKSRKRDTFKMKKKHRHTLKKKKTFFDKYDLYSDANPKDTINISYDTVKNTKATIKNLERLRRSGKYSHARIVQVANVLTQRLRVINDNTKSPAKTRYKLAKAYFERLKRQTKKR